MHNYLETMIKLSRYSINNIRRVQKIAILSVIFLIALDSIGIYTKAWFGVGVCSANLIWMISIYIENYIELKSEMKRLAYYEEDRFCISHAKALETYKRAEENYKIFMDLQNKSEEKY